MLLEEEKGTSARLQDQINSLNSKMRSVRRDKEDAEGEVEAAKAKSRKIQSALDDAEETVTTLQTQLTKARTSARKTRVRRSRRRKGEEEGRGGEGRGREGGGGGGEERTDHELFILKSPVSNITHINEHFDSRLLDVGEELGGHKEATPSNNLPNRLGDSALQREMILTVRTLGGAPTVCEEVYHQN